MILSPARMALSVSPISNTWPGPPSSIDHSFWEPPGSGARIRSQPCGFMIWNVLTVPAMATVRSLSNIANE